MPIASSVRLLKLFPKDGPTWDFSSMAAIKFLLDNNQQVPFLCWPVETWKITDSSGHEDLARIDTNSLSER